MIFHFHLNGPRFTPEIAITAISDGVSESDEVYYEKHKGRKLMRFKQCHVCNDMKKQGAKVLLYSEPKPLKEKAEPAET